MLQNKTEKSTSKCKKSVFKKCSTYGLYVRSTLHTINIMLTTIYVSLWPT